jgi:hypothetical protein
MTIPEVELKQEALQFRGLTPAEVEQAALKMARIANPA